MTIPYPARASLGLAALALSAGAMSGCAAERIQNSPETVSTAGAAAAVAAVQTTTCPGTAPQALSSNVGDLAVQLEPLVATRVLLCVYPAQGTNPSASEATGAVVAPGPSGAGTAGMTGTADTTAPSGGAAASSAAAGGAGASASSTGAGAAPTGSGTSTPQAPTPIVLTRADQISSLRSALNALTPPPTAPVSCPEDTGAAVLGIFTAGTQEVEVLMQTSGCLVAGNGAKTGWVGETDFLSILSSVLGGTQ